ncbi:hypothetical protein CMK22_17405 [Candidatus Poribacteria bacterium]|nr:hypothetical protein [Candidatus Poribacteria bacterium]
MATSNQIIKLWDVPTDKLIVASEVTRKKVSFLALRPESTALVSGNIDATVKLWGVSMAKLQVTLQAVKPLGNSRKVDCRLSLVCISCMMICQNYPFWLGWVLTTVKVGSEIYC